MDMLLDAKQQICDWTEIAKECLHDISLDDVEVSAHALDHIASATHQMAGDAWGVWPAMNLEDPIACKSYWVEHTRELVLFFWNTGQAKAIVIPAEGWMLKSDITIH